MYGNGPHNSIWMLLCTGTSCILHGSTFGSPATFAQIFIFFLREHSCCEYPMPPHPCSAAPLGLDMGLVYPTGKKLSWCHLPGTLTLTYLVSDDVKVDYQITASCSWIAFLCADKTFPAPLHHQQQPVPSPLCCLCTEFRPWHQFQNTSCHFFPLQPLVIEF